jgi:tryptophan synthase beta chain
MGEPGRYGPFGGRYVPEALMEPLIRLEQGYREAAADPAFHAELDRMRREFAGRPTPLTFCRNISGDLGFRLYLKREDLVHGGSHKLNNTLGQALLARHMGKSRLIAETGAGQHGVATAIAGAVSGMEVDVFMGEEDVRRQELNVFRMRLMGARVHSVASGTRTLKDATNEAFRDWVGRSGDTHYLIGSVVGPHPYPLMVREFQSVIGFETARQVREAEGCLPDMLVACVGGGSNAIGLFAPFVKEPGVRMIGVEAAGKGLESGEHGASICAGTEGVLHGALSYILQDNDGQISPTHSIAAGLDYPGVGPEHSWLHASGRAEYAAVTDDEVLRAFAYLSRREGIIPALESAHAIAWVQKMAGEFSHDDVVIVNLSGRGDKDVAQVSALSGGS